MARHAAQPDMACGVPEPPGGDVSDGWLGFVGCGGLVWVGEAWVGEACGACVGCVG